jgi:hypothetical protein
VVNAKPSLIPPAEVVEIARCTMGSIDIDLYGTHEVNRVVQAGSFLARLDSSSTLYAVENGRRQRRALLAIPDGIKLARRLLSELLKHYHRQNIGQAIVWCSSPEVLGACPWLHDFPICHPFRRLAPRYWDDELEEPVRVSPSAWSPVIYLPTPSPRPEFEAGVGRFSAAAGPSGRVIVDRWAGENHWWQDSFESLTGSTAFGP